MATGSWFETREDALLTMRGSKTNKATGENAMKLTSEQIEFFNREGWLFLPELFSPEEVDYLAREAVSIYDANRPEVWREKSGAPRTAFAAHLYNEAFGALGAHPA
jgi:ectoine hydroxylase